MLRHITKHNFFIQCFVVFICMGMGLGPVYAQVSGKRTFDRPLESGSSSESFRQKDVQDQMFQDGGRPGTGRMMPMDSGSSGLMYQVHVLGEVERPGTFRVMASERMAEVLKRAGGVDEQGSERNIEIRRNGKTVKRIDLLRFQLHGELDHNPYLLNNDVVFVPLRKSAIQIVGAVKRPDTYELAGEKNGWAAIVLSGGFSAGASQSEPVRVIRFEDGEKRVIEVGHSKTELANFQIRNGDVIFVSNVVTAGHDFDYDIAKLPGDNVFYPSYEDRVFVLGGVAQPGAHPFSPYYSVHQYISLAGGFSQLATGKLQVITANGKKYRVKDKKQVKINPGDTILVGHRRIPPEGWVTLGMSLASFGLSTTSTILYLQRD